MVLDLLGGQIVLAAAVLGAIAALYRMGRSAFKWALREHERQEALTVLANQAGAIEAILTSELASNDGKSMKDAVCRMDSEIAKLAEQRARGRGEIDRHLEKLDFTLSGVLARLDALERLVTDKLA